MILLTFWYVKLLVKFYPRWRNDEADMGGQTTKFLWFVTPYFNLYAKNIRWSALMPNDTNFK